MRRSGARRLPALRTWARGALRWLCLLFAAAYTASHISLREAPLDLEVEYAGCDPVLLPVGLSCEVYGVSALSGARGPAAPGTLALWVKASPGARVVAAIDGQWREPLGGEVDEQGGRRMVIAVDKGARELTVTARRGRAQRTFRLPIATAEASEDLLSLRDADAIRKGRRPQQMSEGAAREALSAAVDRLMWSDAPAVRAKTKGLLARVRVHEDPAAAMDLFAEAIDDDRAAGLVGDEVADGLAYARLLFASGHDPAAASAILDRVGGVIAEGDFPTGRALLPYFRALLAEERGDLGEARAQATMAEQRARRLDLQRLLDDVYQLQVQLLDVLGRYEDAAAYLEQKVKAPEGPPCAVAQYHTNMGWHRLLARSRGRSARPDLEEARRLFGPQGGCPDARELRNVLTNLADAALDEDRLDEAEALLDEARRVFPRAPALMRVEWAVSAGRLDRLRGRRAEAERLYQEAETLGRAAGLPDFALDATLGRAALLERDQPEEAIRAYERADDQLDQWSRLVPLGEGRQTFFARRERGVQMYLSLLLAEVDRARREGGDAGAWARRMGCVARRSLTRVLAATEWAYHLSRVPAGDPALLRATREREERRAALAREAEAAIHLQDPAEQDQQLADIAARGAQADSAFDAAVSRVAGPRPKLSCEEGASDLPAPGPDEAILVYHPLGGGAWAGIALSATQAVVARLAFDPADVARPADLGRRAARRRRLGELLLGPFEGVLAGKRRVRIVAAEPLGSIDLHDLVSPAGGDRPLGERASVVYGADLGRRADLPARGKRALVVAVPARGLRLPAAEADHVAGALRSDGWSVTSLVGEEATLAAVRRALDAPGVDLFHYAGHGVAKGRDGLESRVMLAGGDALSISDVLATARGPRLVVLASCQAAAPAGDAYVAGSSLAHAFLIAGADFVMASPYDNEDDATLQVMDELYTRHLATLRDDPAAALRASLGAMNGRPDLSGVPLPRMRVLSR